ncbi:hypothetical protein HK097_005314, partial [Rhizophlyctis rosea]
LHPDLWRHPYGTPRKAAEFFFQRAVKGVDEVEDKVEHVQVLTLLGVWGYGNIEGGGKSWVYISLAIRAAERLELGYKKKILPHQYPFNPFDTGPSDIVSPAELAKRRRIWSFCFATDTYSAMVQGSNPGMEESDYLHVLISTAFNGHDNLDVLGRKRSVSTSSMPTISSSSIYLTSTHDITPPHYTGLWRQFLKGHPRYTIHDCSPQSWRVDAENLEHLCAHSKPWVMQCAWIMRRIKKVITGRLAVLPSNGGVPPTAGAILAIHPPDPDLRALHEVLMRWWNGIPRNERAYENLEVFREGIPDVVGDVAQLWSLSHVVLNLFSVAAVSMLHQSNAGDGRRVFATGVEGGSLDGRGGWATFASSAEILLLCVRAQNYVVRSVYAAHGFGSIPFAPGMGQLHRGSFTRSNGVEPPFSPDFPAPPACFIQSPMTCWALFASSVAFMLGAFGRLGEGEDAEGLTFVNGVVCPTLENCARVWPVCYTYEKRLVEVVRGEMERRSGPVGVYGL